MRYVRLRIRRALYADKKLITSATRMALHVNTYFIITFDAKPRMELILQRCTFSKKLK